jgi:hypothetical protein
MDSEAKRAFEWSLMAVREHAFIMVNYLNIG